MSTAFVILAAGRGTRIGRVGESLHKALVPLGQTAVLTHLINLAPSDARIIICTGHRSEQIEAYVKLAHPKHDIDIAYVDGWDRPGGGPGRSLLAARPYVDGDMIFTSCDTLWAEDPNLWTGPSWAAVAPVPAGTPPQRWCRIGYTRSTGLAVRVIDKQPRGDGDAYVGLARIIEPDQDVFWTDVESGDLLAGELQVSNGLEGLAIRNRLHVRHVRWTDVGDEAAYRRAVAQHTGYDWTKLDEATYVLPDEGRVVKFFSDPTVLERRRTRAVSIADAVPSMIESIDGMLAYEYVHGEITYKTAEWDAILVPSIMQWAEECLWQPVPCTSEIAYEACMRFYRDKTLERVAMLEPALRVQCEDVVSRIGWDELAVGFDAVTFHGDLNMGNMVTVAGDKRFIGIDWRQDFAGYMWGDKRYDIAKLLAGTVVHWDNARKGDFRPWIAGAHHATEIRKCTGYSKDIEIIGALSLLNSAPLHASPLDEVLVSRGVSWLEEATA